MQKLIYPNAKFDNGVFMKQEAEIKNFFILNTIHLVATSGFEGATVRKIAELSRSQSGLKVSETYVYRLFGSKENLYRAAFEFLDNEQYVAFMQGVEATRGFTRDIRERAYNFFEMAWKFLLKNEDRFRCYISYYHSPYFKGEVLEEHNRLFMGVVRQISPLFKEEADVVSIAHSVLTTMLDFAFRVYNGDLVDNDENRSHIFNVVYLTMSAYFKKTI